MAAVSKLYGLNFSKAFNKEIDWDTDTIKVMLCTSSYVPNQDTHAYKSDVTNEVAVGATTYTLGGALLGSKTVAYDAPTNAMILDAADVTWTGGAPMSRVAVVYDATPGTDATRPLIGYIDFGADLQPLTIQWDATGIFAIAAF